MKVIRVEEHWIMEYCNTKGQQMRMKMRMLVMR